MSSTDSSLRALYRLANYVSGAQLERVQAEIRRRRTELELADAMTLTSGGLSQSQPAPVAAIAAPPVFFVLWGIYRVSVHGAPIRARDQALEEAARFGCGQWPVRHARADGCSSEHYS